MKKKNQENLTPAQRRVKAPRRVIYGGTNANTSPDLARDIITLYLTCQLGYSPIRHLIGASTDKKIEDVVRQHMLGRKNVRDMEGELYCKSSTTVEEYYKPILDHIASKYKTKGDPYVAKLLATGIWSDDPVKPKIKICPKCGKDLQDDWNGCPYCFWKREGDSQKRLFQ